MTIAACFVTPEGVVLGADSTASIMLSGGFHYFNYNQKVFEIGEPGMGTIGLVTWGLGGLGGKSYRTLVGQFGDLLTAQRAKTMAEVADRWVDLVWADYSPLLGRCQSLSAKKPFDPNVNLPDPNSRTNAEEEEFIQLQRGLGLGFFIGGHLLPDRAPQALSIYFDPLSPKPSPAPFWNWNFAGAPNMIKRLIWGCDDQWRAAILASGKWNGTSADLDGIIAQYQLSTPLLPIRDAIDFVHACIASTIKAMKFSEFAQACGGPIEIAVITTDRRFRWVRHKTWDAAITDGAQQ